VRRLIYLDWKMSNKDLDVINSIIAIADAMQERLDRLEARQTFTIDQHVSLRACCNTCRGFRSYDLAELKKLFDPEYKNEMERLTLAAKGEKIEKK